jgi:Hydrazine synthase alpha subunit middle domain
MISTPVAIGNGTWDVKQVLGNAKVHEDGSALFTVPARTPVYFQALDERGYAVQTMRSWSTLQPGETFSCVGCHDNKNTAARTDNYRTSLAMTAGVQQLEPFHGPPRGFSFRKEIQPILDRHCIRCHDDRAPVQKLVSGETRRSLLKRSQPANTNGDGSCDEPAFSLLANETVDQTAKRKWSDAYLLLTQSRAASASEPDREFIGEPRSRVVNWIGSQSAPEPQPPYVAGAVRSSLMTLLETGHQGVKLTRAELERIACWIDLLVPYCGDYLEANAWTEDEMQKYQHFATKRRQMEMVEQQNIRDLLDNQSRRAKPAALSQRLR